MSTQAIDYPTDHKSFQLRFYFEVFDQNGIVLPWLAWHGWSTGVLVCGIFGQLEADGQEK